MTQIENQTYDMERALYGQQDLILNNCAFDGPADGESALKEREALQKREQELRELRHASRLARKITIDFAGRQILEEDSGMAEYHSK